MLKIWKKAGILLASVMILMFAATVFAGQAADYDDPDYVKRLLNEAEEDDEEISASRSSGQKSDFTGSTYTHADIYTSGDYEILQGVDVSKWSADVNWTKVKNAGISFTFIRVGYTSMSSTFSKNKDPYYAQNLKEAKAAGVKVGVYYFSQATTESEAKKEANYTLKLLDGASLDYPVVFDMEALSGGRLYTAVKNGTVSKTAAVKICKAYCNIISAAGYDVIIYTNKDHLENVFDAKSLLASFDNFWFARYNTIAHKSSECSTYQKNGQTTLESFFHDGKYMFWQYTDSGSVPGISNAADCNFQYVKKSSQQEETTQESAAEETTAEETQESTAEEKAETVTVGKVSSVKAAARKSTSIKISWKAVSGVTGYQIYRSTAKNGTYKKIKTVTSTSYTNKNLSKYCQYYYKVRAYVKKNGKVTYGKFSSVTALATKATSFKAKTTGSVYVRQYAGTAYKKLTVLAKGKKVTVSLRTKDKKGKWWYKVSVKNGKKTYKGYVSASYLKKVK